MEKPVVAAAVAAVAPVRAPSPVIGRRSSTPTSASGGKLNSNSGNNGFNVVNRHVNGYAPVMGYPSLYEPPKSSVGSTGVSTPGPAPPPPPPPAPHYFPVMGYSTPSLAPLHQYLMAAHLANPLRNVPVNNSSSSPIYKDMDAVALAAELDRKRKRSDSGIEDSTSKFVTDSKHGRYQQNDGITSGHQSPAEIEKVKKILETVNANVTRQLLEARVKSAQHGHYIHHPISSSPLDKHDFSEGKFVVVVISFWLSAY